MERGTQADRIRRGDHWSPGSRAFVFALCQARRKNVGCGRLIIAPTDSDKRGGIFTEEKSNAQQRAQRIAGKLLTMIEGAVEDGKETKPGESVGQIKQLTAALKEVLGILNQKEAGPEELRVILEGDVKDYAN